MLFPPNLSTSLDSPPKVNTVRIEERTSSATVPAAAYWRCSLVVKDAVSFAKMPPLMAMMGVKANRSRVSLHSWEKATAKPAKKVVNHWIMMPSLSPIPT